MYVAQHLLGRELVVPSSSLQGGIRMGDSPKYCFSWCTPMSDNHDILTKLMLLPKVIF